MEDSGVKGGGQGCLKALGVLLLMALAAVVAVLLVGRYAAEKLFDPDPVTIANASLQGLREQNRLSTFQARYVAVVTTTQTRMGLSAKKTLIMPGMVRYEVDLARLNQRDVAWDAGAKKLSIRLPPVEVVGPQVDLNAVREYGEGGILMALTDSEERLDAANRKAGQAELIRQAREKVPMDLAREATRRAVERSFAMPLKAVGIDATVDAWFPDERGASDLEQWDRTRTIEQVLGNRR